MKTTVLALLSTLTLLSSASAGPMIMRATPAPNSITPSHLFMDTEFFFDVYGSYLRHTDNGDCTCPDEGSHKNHGFGGGFSIGDYINPYIGFRADVNFSSVHDAQTQVAADLMLRLPIDDSAVAPYIFGGGGVEAGRSSHGFLRLGGGLEWRVSRGVGIFAEGSYAWIYDDDRSKNLTVKLGMRFAY